MLPVNWGVAFTVFETVTISYDIAGNKIDERLTTAAGGSAVQSATQTSYDANNRPLCTAARMNMGAIPAIGSDACALSTAGSYGQDRITKTIYDVAGQVVQVRKAVASTSPSLEQAYATYSYTANGKHEYVIDANGTGRSWSMTAMTGRPTGTSPRRRSPRPLTRAARRPRSRRRAHSTRRTMSSIAAANPGCAKRSPRTPDQMDDRPLSGCRTGLVNGRDVALSRPQLWLAQRQLTAFRASKAD